MEPSFGNQPSVTTFSQLSANISLHVQERKETIDLTFNVKQVRFCRESLQNDIAYRQMDQS